MYKVMTKVTGQPCCDPNVERCGLCGAKPNSSKTVGRESGSSELTSRNMDDELRDKVRNVLQLISLFPSKKVISTLK